MDQDTTHTVPAPPLERSTLEMTAVAESDVHALCDLLLAEVHPQSTAVEEFLGRRFDLGLAWVHFPVGEGGLGAPRELQRIVNERMSEVGAPTAATRNPLGHGMAAPTIAAHGTAMQRHRYLRPLFTGQEIWCQLFSEPDAGSDIAALSTSARRDGDEWLISGQKVWTTHAHIARWGLLVARTDPQALKHQGLTYFIADMTAPGVEVLPLVQMTGEAEFNEVYLTDVCIPDSQRLSEVGDGWRVVLTTLMNERVAIGGGVPKQGAGMIGKAIEVWNTLPKRNPVMRDRLAKLWSTAEVLRLTNMRAAHQRAAGSPGPEGSIGKILSATLSKAISEFAVDALGAEGTLKPGGYPMQRPRVTTMWVDPQHALLRTRALSIEGGTTEIAKNVLAERVLGLPGELRPDKGVPWRDIPRS
jgi:alkylation response protein AidB-like acyl-CoA dehydrogenase